MYHPWKSRAAGRGSRRPGRRVAGQRVARRNACAKHSWVAPGVCGAGIKTADRGREPRIALRLPRHLGRDRSDGVGRPVSHRCFKRSRDGFYFGRCGRGRQRCLPDCADAGCSRVPVRANTSPTSATTSRLTTPFNYRAGEPPGYFKKGAPEGIHVYFDNTGGPQLEAALYVLRDHGRVGLCSGIAGYNTPVPGPRN